MCNTSHKGRIAETHVLNELVKRGFNVSIPFGDLRYDLVAEKNGRFHRIQVKYLSWTTNRNTLQILLHSITRNGRNKYTAGEIDYFIAYFEPTAKSYIIPFADIKNRGSLQLRLATAANNQRANITMAAQYEDRWDLLLQEASTIE